MLRFISVLRFDRNSVAFETSLLERNGIDDEDHEVDGRQSNVAVHYQEEGFPRVRHSSCIRFLRFPLAQEQQRHQQTTSRRTTWNKLLALISDCVDNNNVDTRSSDKSQRSAESDRLMKNLPQEEECVDAVRCIRHDLVQKHLLRQRFAILESVERFKTIHLIGCANV